MVMKLYLLIIKTLVLYFFIILCYRIMGKKEVGQLSVIDLIVSMLIAEMAAMSIEEDKSIWVSIIPIFVLVAIQMILSYVTLKNVNIRKFVDGTPTIIINDGKLDFKQMKNLRYSLEDLISQLREQGVKSIEEVNYAVLENNGKLSVFKDKVYPLPIIIEGCIDYDTLKNINKNETWLYHILDKNNITLDDVFYAFYAKNKTYIIRKSEVQ